MEHEAFGGHDVHVVRLDELRKRADAVCKDRCLPGVTITVRRVPGSVAMCYPEDGRIILGPKRGKNLLTLAHELAHYVVHHKHPKAKDHGPTFIRVYAEIVEELGVIPKDAFLKVARKHGLL